MKDGSTLVINNDNDMLSTVNLNDLDIVKVAIDTDGDFKALNVVLKDDSSSFEIYYQDKK